MVVKECMAVVEWEDQQNSKREWKTLSPISRRTANKDNNVPK